MDAIAGLFIIGFGIGLAWCGYGDIDIPRHMIDGLLLVWIGVAMLPHRNNGGRK